MANAVIKHQGRTYYHRKTSTCGKVAHLLVARKKTIRVGFCTVPLTDIDFPQNKFKSTERIAFFPDV
ncbi:MAG: hypothetical protein GY943_11880 [Chloroflexi bacterium]|nr:hypothetical protein [Chloroflexota bacterium]